MDTTKEYIMMVDCPEIQEQCPRTMIGSTKHYYKAIYQYEIDTSGNVRFWDGKHFIWLPHQDQLQDMLPYKIGDAKDNFWSALADLFEWAYHEKWLDYIPLSMEQLWLAFVMKEKYHKVWDGNEWATSKVLIV